MDRLIGLVENATRQKTPGEIALLILLSAFSIIFLAAVGTLWFFSDYSVEAVRQRGVFITTAVLFALLVCLIPTTIGGLLSAIGISSVSRLIKKNVLALSGRAVDAAGDIDVMLLDKTGTVTMGNRMASAFYPARACRRTSLQRRRSWRPSRMRPPKADPSSTWPAGTTRSRREHVGDRRQVRARSPPRRA